MESNDKFRTNCYDLSHNKDDYINEWSNNQTTNRVVDINPFPKFPHLYYTVLNQTHFQWCGAMLMFVEYFAKMTKTK